MPRMSTNDLIDTVTKVLMEYPWTEHFQEVSDMESYSNESEADVNHRRRHFEDLAREIAKAVR